MYGQLHAWTISSRLKNRQVAVTCEQLIVIFGAVLFHWTGAKNINGLTPDNVLNIFIYGSPFCVFIHELQTLKMVQFFWPTRYFFSISRKTVHIRTTSSNVTLQKFAAASFDIERMYMMYQKSSAPTRRKISIIATTNRIHYVYCFHISQNKIYATVW